MSVAKAEFRVVHRLVKDGRIVVPGETFIAGTKGAHVRRWLTQSKIVLVGPVAAARSTRRLRTVRTDRSARALGLLLLAGFLLLATKVAGDRRDARELAEVQLFAGAHR